MTERAPAVAGMFYPADAAELAAMVDGFLAAAGAPPQRSRVVVAPHAGYVYSGALAGVAHAHLRLDGVRRVAVLGPCHRVAARGIAAPEADRWRTPLGSWPVQVPDDVAAHPAVFASDVPHAPEHSLEVHLPFLQRRLAHGSDDVALVPLAVGLATPDEVADVLDLLLADPATAVVVSSDLSHYLPDDVARATDRHTLNQIVAAERALAPEQACGARPVNGLMTHARRHGHRLVELGYATSADTAGGPDRVVGYPALLLEETR